MSERLRLLVFCYLGVSLLALVVWTCEMMPSPPMQYWFDGGGWQDGYTEI